MARTAQEQIGALFPLGTNIIAMSASSLDAELIEAEQRGYERAKAECAEDTKRLDFMDTPRLDAMKTSNGEWRIMSISGDTAETLGEGDDLRAAIDAAMKEDGE